MTTWTDIATALNLTVQLKSFDWGKEVPPYDTQPSEALDEEVDGWCVRLANNLMAPLEPPPLVKPWIYIRLILAGVACKFLEEAGEPAPERLTPEVLIELLVLQWHAGLKDRWGMMITDDLNS